MPPYRTIPSPEEPEVFTDVTEGERHESDLVAQVKFRGKESFFLIHVEAQESSRQWFNRRMFTYFARFHEKFVLPIYPIVIFSYSKPKRAAISQYVVDFPQPDSPTNPRVSPLPILKDTPSFAQKVHYQSASP